MDIIREYAEKITVFVILGAYIDVLMPSNSYRKYIRLIFGAVLISIVTEPLSALFGG